MNKDTQLPRRTFLKQAGIGLPFLASSHIEQNKSIKLPRYSYGHLNQLEQVLNFEGELAIRMAFESSNPQTIAKYEGNLYVRNARIVRGKSYFVEREEDVFDGEKIKWSFEASGRSADIIVIWLEKSSRETELEIEYGKETFSTSVHQLLSNPEVMYENGDAIISINILPYKEIGEIDPVEVGIKVDGDDFSFCIMADPQGGTHTAPKVDSPTRMKVHNAFIEESIRRVNELDPQPAFTIVNGDFVDSKGQIENFEAMIAYYKELKSPLLIELGNHETAYSAKFTPGYQMEAFSNYFAAQKAINGLEKLLYSFNLGNWHFIIWPDPLRDNFWETHPHYFDWLEKDLEKYKDRPTMFIQHVPLHPIGINPLINYVESVEFKRTMLDILSTHGNVKYVFSGHVHIPFKASLKTACSYKGMKLINLPPAGYRPRAFGEEDIEGGPSQGVAIVNIEGDEAFVRFQNVIGKTYDYPKFFPEFSPSGWPLWLTHPWELPAAESIYNGNFEKGLDGWCRRFVYQEDKNPSNICEVRRNINTESYQSLYLFSRTRGYMAPGQDRLPQSLNRVCQAVEVKKNQDLILSFKYKVEPAYDESKWAGAYIWIEGYTKSHKKLNLLYSVGKAYRDPGGKRSKSFQAGYEHYQLPVNPGKIQKAHLALKEDASKAGKDWELLKMDRLLIHLGVWVQNDYADQTIGIYFDDLSLEPRSLDDRSLSMVDAEPVSPTPPEEIYNKRIDHICGEHVQVGR